jgi:hypothetical protein
LRQELAHYARLAQLVLLQDVPYKFDKAVLASLFSSQLLPGHEQMIALRLTAIDGYYSTNMSKRHYWIEDIVAAFAKAGADDSSLKAFFLDYIESPVTGSPGSSLLNSTYGITKGGAPSNRAHSLLSKYAYFLTNGCFPIYDTLVRESYNRLSKRFPDTFAPCPNLDDVDVFFQRFSVLRADFGDFDLLDNLLWLLGKVSSGSLSLVLSKERYVLVRQSVKGELSGVALADTARQDNRARAALGPDLCEFIEFAQTLSPHSV